MHNPIHLVLYLPSRLTLVLQWYRAQSELIDAIFRPRGLYFQLPLFDTLAQLQFDFLIPTTPKCSYHDFLKYWLIHWFPRKISSQVFLFFFTFSLNFSVSKNTWTFTNNVCFLFPNSKKKKKLLNCDCVANAILRFWS